MNAAAITTAGLECLDEDGLDKLTMRSVAGRLGVQVGGLYYHVPDKAALLRLMGDRLCGEMLEALAAKGAPSPPDAATDGLAVCLAVRTVLLAHRDGARILAGSPLVGSERALELMERLMAILAPGIAEAQIATCADALLSYVTGYVLQEQQDAPVDFDPAAVESLRVRFPRVFAGATAGTPSEATFRTSVAAIIAGFGAAVS